VGRKRGAHLRANVQEADQRRGRVWRAGNGPQAAVIKTQGPVNSLVVQGRVVFLPGEISPYV
jgi:hypothetical protein